MEMNSEGRFQAYKTLLNHKKLGSQMRYDYLNRKIILNTVYFFMYNEDNFFSVPPKPHIHLN